MRLLNNPVTRICTLLLTVMLLHSACGGGGGDGDVNPDRAEKGVFTGFSGNFDYELYQDGGPGDGEGEGVGEGADGDGGVGVGGALGQFRGALVRVFFPSGEQLGEALTDNNTGMVTVKPGKTYNGSLLIEIHGQAGATYFEEGKNQYVPFGPGEVLRAIVPDVRRNIGITPFSEAGYKLALQCQQGQGPTAVCGSSQGTSNQTLPSMAAIRAANEKIEEVLNQQLPFSMQVDDVTRLPVIVGDQTGPGSADTNARGRYGLANIAFSKQAAMYNTAQTAPTLLATEQFSNDLLDGKLDGKSGGQSAAPAAERTYDPHSFTSEMTAALAQQANLYGTGGAISSLPLISAFGNVRYDGYYFDARIGKAGEAETVAVATETASTERTPGQITEYVRPQGNNRGFMVYGNMGNGGLIVKTDSLNSTSQILAIGDNINGELGVGRDGEVERPAPVNIPGVLTHAVGGFGHLLARFADGSVYTVGDNSESQLGVGMNGGALANALTPQRVALPEGAIAVAAANAASFALLESGQVYSWGSGWGFGTLGDGNADGLRVSPEPVMSTNGPLTDVVQLAARDNDGIVLKSDNSVWTWGSFSQSLPTTGETGVRPGNTVATRVNGLPDGDIRKVLTEQGLFIALMADGAVYSWGIHFDITAQDFLYDMQPTRVLNLPPLRDVMPGGFNGYGQRPFDRLTAMGVDYSGRYWKVRGRVAERYDPLNPTAQRRPRTQAPRQDCASCHTVREATDPTLPGSGPACALPAFKLDQSGAPVLVNSESDCASCHNGGTLGTGRVLSPLTCVKPSLPAPAPITEPTALTEQCALPTNHPVSGNQLGNSCATCHNSVITKPLTCSVDQGVVAPPSRTTVNIDSATDDFGQVTGNIDNSGITDDATPTFVGTISAALVAGERIEVRANGRALGNATVSGVSWSLTPAALTEGTYSVTARVMNAGGAGGQISAAFELTVSTSSITQTVRITSLRDNVGDPGDVANGAASNDPTPNFIGTVSAVLSQTQSLEFQRTGPDGTRTFAGSVDNTDYGVTDPNPLQENGRYTYTARIVDRQLGQTGAASAPWAVIFDNVAPAVPRLLEVFADFPASQLPVAGAIAPNGGTNDNTPELRAIIDNASTGDGIEFFESDTLLSNGPVAVDGQGRASHTHLTNFDLGQTAASTFFLRYNVRSVDAAGNRSAASPIHRVNFGLFNCETLRQLNGNHNQGQQCRDCHENVSVQSNIVTAVILITQKLRVPDPGQYWCGTTAISDLLVPLPR